MIIINGIIKENSPIIGGYNNNYNNNIRSNNYNNNNNSNNSNNFNYINNSNNPNYRPRNKSTI